MTPAVPGEVITIEATARADNAAEAKASVAFVVINPVFRGQTFYTSGKQVMDRIVDGKPIYRWEPDPIMAGVRIKRILGAKGPGNVQVGIQTTDGSLFQE